MTLTHADVNDLDRHALFMRTPALWPAWPFLPLVRRNGAAEKQGLLFDAWGVAELTGYLATVFVCNLFDLPPTLAGLLASPRETFDTIDDLLAARWRVD